MNSGLDILLSEEQCPSKPRGRKPKVAANDGPSEAKPTRKAKAEAQVAGEPKRSKRLRQRHRF